MKKKIMAIVLSVVMILGLLTVPAGAVHYADAQKSWAKDSINRWSDQKIINGDENGNVNPEKPLRRCEMAQILVNLLGLTDRSPLGTFNDVSAAHWYADAVLKCHAAGIMGGWGGGAHPEDPVTREEAMAMLARAMGVKPDEDPDLSMFDDRTQVAEWARGYMSALARMGIVNGVAGTSANLAAPAQSIDRASMAAMLDKAITVYANKPGAYTCDNPNGFVVVCSAAGEEGAVTVSGKAASVVVAAGTADAVTLSDLTVETVKVDGGVKLSIAGKTSVTDLELNAPASVEVEKAVKVGNTAVNDKGAEIAEITPTPTPTRKPSSSSGGSSSGGSSSGGNTTPVTPVITITAPASAQSVAKTEGETLTLTVTASNTGSSTLSYQWKKGTETIPGATSATYTKANLTAADAGEYTCVVSGTNGAVSKTSPVFTVTVASPEPQPTTYAITVNQVGGTGTVTVAETAAEGTEVTVAAALEGYTAAITVAKTSGGAAVTFENGKFTMPGEAVTVTVTWTADSEPEPDPDPEPEEPTAVTTAAELTAALAGEASEITINGTLGSTSETTVYTVNRAVTIKKSTAQGATAEIFGSFVVKADGVVFDGLTIKNKGDNAGGAERNAISAYAKTLTVKNCTLECATAEDVLANGLNILPSAADVTYTVTNNTFKSYNNSYDGSWSSTAILITGGITRDYLGGTASVAAAMTDEADLAILNNNSFLMCNTDYVRDDYTSGSQKISARCNSTVGNTLNFNKAASTAKFYIKGEVVRTGNTTLKSGSTLTILPGGSFAVEAPFRLKVNDGAQISGTITGNVARADANGFYNVITEVENSFQTFGGAYYNKQPGYQMYAAPGSLTSFEDGDEVSERWTMNRLTTASALRSIYFLVDDGYSKTPSQITLNTTDYNGTSDVGVGLGNNSFLYAKAFRKDDANRLWVLLPLLGGNVDGSGKVTVTVTNTDSTESTFKFRVFDYPEANKLTVDAVTGISNCTVSTQPATPSAGNPWVAAANVSGTGVNPWIGVKLLDDGAPAAGSAGKYLIRYDKSNKYDLAFTEIGETVEGETYTYTLFPYGYDDATVQTGDKTREYRLMIPGSGYVDITINVTGLPTGG